MYLRKTQKKKRGGHRGGGGTGGSLGGGFVGDFAGTQDPYSHPKAGSVPECHRFAAVVDLIAQNNGDPSNFMQSLRDQFMDLKKPEWGSGGFKSQFKDDTPPGNSPNQVRHYVGTFEAGYVGGKKWGYSVGLQAGLYITDQHELEFDTRTNARGDEFPYIINEERTNWPTHVADRNLNRVSVNHGALLGSGRIKPPQLGNLIRKEVCQ